jgi:hypothetical protein
LFVELTTAVGIIWMITIKWHWLLQEYRSYRHYLWFLQNHCFASFWSLQPNYWYILLDYCKWLWYL